MAWCKSKVLSSCREREGSGPKEMTRAIKALKQVSVCSARRVRRGPARVSDISGNSEMSDVFVLIKIAEARNGLRYQCRGNIQGFLVVVLRLHKQYRRACSIERRREFPSGPPAGREWRGDLL